MADQVDLKRIDYLQVRYSRIRDRDPANAPGKIVD
jgi:hypothetical protein